MSIRKYVSMIDVFIRNSSTYVGQITIQMISFRSIKEFHGSIFFFLAHYHCGHTDLFFFFSGTDPSTEDGL